MLCFRSASSSSFVCTRVMGRRHVGDPRQATHDPLTHMPSRNSGSDRNRYPTSVPVPDGYADYAMGGGKHVPPPHLGHHDMTDRFQDAVNHYEGRSVGASREEIAPNANHWSTNTDWQLHADSEMLDGSVPGTEEALRRSRQNTETHIRFQQPPAGFESKVNLPRRHPTDASINGLGLIKQKVGEDFPDAYTPEYEALGAFEEKPETRRPFPPPVSTLKIGDGVASHERVFTSNEEQFAEPSGRETYDEKRYAGRDDTNISGYDLITGAVKLKDPHRACSYEHHGASGYLQFRKTQNVSFNGNGDPLLSMRPSKKGFKVTPASYDNLTGAAHSSEKNNSNKSSFEHPGIKRANPGLVKMNSGSRRGFTHGGDASGSGKWQQKIDTTPW